LRRNGKKGIRLDKENFIGWYSYSETYESIARIRLAKTEDVSMCNSEL
jgi:hypothetical protein